MTSLVIAFVVITSVLLGAMLAGAFWVQQVVRAMARHVSDVRGTKSECEKLIATITQAHNNTAQKILEIQDKLKGMELKAAQGAFLSRSK